MTLLLSNSARLRFHIDLHLDFHSVIHLSLILGVQLLSISLQLFNLIFVGENLLGEFESTLGAFGVPLGVSVLDVEDAKHAVLAHGEEVRVRVRHPQPSDRARMRLDLCSLLKRKFPDLNRAWVHRVTLLTNASEKNLARVMNAELA